MTTGSSLQEKPERLVLVVDDELDLVNLLMRRLSRRGFRVISAQSKLQALKLMGEQSVSVIICDINLGDSSGFDLYRERRAMSGAEPFVFLSGIDDLTQYESEIKSDKSCEFLNKPVDFQILLETLSKAMNSVN